MGSKTSYLYSIPLFPPMSPFETAIYGHPDNKKGEYKSVLDSDIETLQDLYLTISQKYKDNNCLGKRHEDGPYYFRTYDECFEIAKSLGTTILKMNFANKCSDDFFKIDLEVIGIFSKNREEWILTDLACGLYGITSIPIPDSINIDHLYFILEQTKISTLFCSKQVIDIILSMKTNNFLETLICYDQIDKELETKLREHGLDYCSFYDLIQCGSDYYKFPKVKPQTIFTISYTSGSGGNPRGVLISHQNMIAAIINAISCKINLNSDDCLLSYLPLSHIFERFFLNYALTNGSKIGFYNGELLKLKSDIVELKPTVFASIPKIYAKFNKVFQTQVDKLTGFTKCLALKAISNKTEKLKKGEGYKSFIYDNLFFNKIKHEFGFKFKWMISAAAPLNPLILNNLKILNSCPFIEAYGLTESTGATFATQPNDTTSGHVGGPGYNVEFKIIDVESMNYKSTDKNELGENTPRGELLIRGPSISMGYFQNPNDNLEFYEEGWLHTGDIVLLNTKNGSISIVDRKKDIFKQAPGEYILPGKIEKIYSGCKCVSEIFIHGEPYEDFLIGIISINLEWIDKIKNLNESIDEFLEKKDTYNLIMEELEEVAKNGGLFGYEKIRKIHVITESFAQKGFLTSTLKLKRHEIKEKFAKIINEMYKKEKN